jgi:hypothetical protein
MLFGQGFQPKKDPKELESKPFRQLTAEEATFCTCVIHGDHVDRLESFLESVGGTTFAAPGCHEPGYYALHLSAVEIVLPRGAMEALRELVERCGSKLDFDPSSDFKRAWEDAGGNITTFKARRINYY